MGPPTVWGSDFLESERNFTIGQGPRSWGKFSKMCTKTNKNWKIIKNIREKKCKFFRKLFNFGGTGKK